MLPLIISLTILYVIFESISAFDKRFIQAKRDGVLPPDETLLPSWIAIFTLLGWGIFIALILLNWKYSILVIGIKLVLQALPVLETIGNFLTAPFKTKKK